MRRICVASAAMAAGIVAPAASADVFTILASGTIDIVSNKPFASPFGDIDVGSSWSLAIAYDTDIPPDDLGQPTPGFNSFKDSLCDLQITVGTHTFGMDQLADDCEFIVTDDICDCGGRTFEVGGGTLGEFGFSFVILDDLAAIIPFLDLPTTDDDLMALADDVQFDFFAPSTIDGVTTTATSLSAMSLTIESGKGGPFIPTPGTAGLLAFGGLLAARRKR